MTVKAALAAEKRDGTGKSVARKLRASGRVPAIVYGADQEAIPLTLDAHETLQLFQGISVENTIIDVMIDGEDDSLETLVREIQVHPLRQHILHVDFLAIQRGVSIEVEIPIRFEGTALGVRDGGGVLDVVLHDLRVRCIPSKIPSEIVVDITDLDVGDSLHTQDIPLSEGVELATEGRTVCSVAIPKTVVLDTVTEEEEDGVDDADDAETESSGGDE